MAFINAWENPHTGQYIGAAGTHESRLSALRNLYDSGRLRSVTCEIGFCYIDPTGTLHRVLFSELKNTAELELARFPRVTIVGQ